MSRTSEKHVLEKTKSQKKQTTKAKTQFRVDCLRQANKTAEKLLDTLTGDLHSAAESVLRVHAPRNKGMFD